MKSVFTKTIVQTSTPSAWSTTGNDQITNTTTETAFTDYFPLGLVGYPVSAINGVRNMWGAGLRITMYGYMSTAAVPGTLQFNVRLAGNPYVITGTVIGTTGAFTPPANLSNAFFRFEGIAVLRTSEPTQTNTQGRFEGALTIQNASNAPFLQGIVNTGTGLTGFAAAVALNSTSQSLNITAQWGTADVGNIITAANVVWESLNQEF